MKIECPQCRYTSDVDDTKLPDREVLARCPECLHRFPFNKMAAVPPTRQSPESIRCPKCDAEQTPGSVCQQCGVIFAKVSLPQRNETPVPRKDVPSNRPFWKQRVGVLTTILITVIIAAPIVSYVGDKVREITRVKRWLREDATERVKAPSWQYDIRAFAGGQERQDIEVMFRNDGFRVRSVSDSGIRPEDKSSCWMIVKDAWGIPALHVSAFFDQENGLNSVRLSFAPDQYPAVTRQLNLYGRKIQSYLGMDGVTPVDGWILDNGIVTSSSSPDKVNGIVAYWVSREIIEQDINAYLQSKKSRSYRDTKGLSDAFVAEVRSYWPMKTQ